MKNQLCIAYPRRVRAGQMKRFAAFCCALFLTGMGLHAAASMGPLTVHPANPRYFSDGTGKAVYLTGSHTWVNVQDRSGAAQSPFREGFLALDFDEHLAWLKARNYNFIRLWMFESRTNFGPVSPLPYVVTDTPGAADGGNKFDVNQLNQAYFDRLRERVIQARDQGLYVSVMLFNGWSTHLRAGDQPWPGHPFHPQNNINGINGDPNNDNGGEEAHQLLLPAITTLQKTYIRKVVDTVNDLDNVLYEISNESPANSTAWQYEMINYLKQYEAGKAKQHPVGMTFQWSGGNNNALLNSPADWISPSGADGYISDPPAATGTKVIITDTDHIWGLGGNPEWVWKSFLRGLNPIFMDDMGPEAWQDALRAAMGQTLTYANKVNLVTMTPRGDLASTTYCLANPGFEYLVYQSGSGAFTVNLTGAPETFRVEWFNPANGSVTAGSEVVGGTNQSFTPSFSGPAVLFLRSTGVAFNQSPTVVLTSPGGGASYSVPASLTVTAEAADTDGSISRVDFYQNGIPLGTDTNAPFSVNWNIVAASNYNLTAIATDNQGASTTSSKVNFRVTSGPTPDYYRAIDLNGWWPSPGLVIDGNTWVSSGDIPEFSFVGAPFTSTSTTALDPAADASKTSMLKSCVWKGGNASVKLSLSGLAAGAYLFYLYVWEDNYDQTYSVLAEGQILAANFHTGPGGHWEKLGPFTVAVNDGTLNLEATGGDALISGLEIWSLLVNLPPTVSITSPASNVTITVGQSVDFAGSGTDADGNLPLTYLWDFAAGSGVAEATTNTPGLVQFNNAGVYTVNFTVTDSLGLANPTPASRTVTVGKSNALVVLDSQTHVYDGSGKSASASTVPAGLRVELSYDGDLALPTNAGTYEVVGIITEVNYTGGATNTLTISNAPPTVTLTSPTHNARFHEPAEILLSAEVTDNGGGVARVEFYHGSDKIGEVLTNPYHLTWSNVQSGLYELSARVIDNAGISNASAPANIRVTPPIQLLSAGSQAGGSFRFVMQGMDGVTYVVEATTNLTSWTPVLTNSPTGNLLEFIDPAAVSFPSRFFRVREE